MGKEKKAKGKPTKAHLQISMSPLLRRSLKTSRPDYLPQPAHPLPIKMAPPSAELPLAKLGKEPRKKKQRERKDSVDEHSPSSESSEEPVLDTNLSKDEKEDKKTAEVKPGTSPTLSTPNSEDASMLSDLLDKDGTDKGEDTSGEERSPNTDDLLNGISPLNDEEVAAVKQEDEDSTAEKQDDTVITAENFEEYLQVVQNNNSEIRDWYDGKGFPLLMAVEPVSEDLDKYIEDVLSHSHKWKDQKDVKCTLDGIDLKDQMARVNCKYTQNLFLRLGRASNPHLEMVKSHALAMKTSALAWQEEAIKSINETAANLQQDNKRVLRDIRNEAAQEVKKLRKQLDLLNKKHLDLQNELNFTNAALALKTKMETPKDANLDTQKIAELTRELGEQRKSNEVLEKQLHELLESFSNYKTGHLREELESNLKDRKDFKKEPPIKDDPVRDSRRQRSPSWGRTRKEETPASSDWDSKGESSASQSDFGWGPTRSRRHGKSRTPPRDDARFEKPQSKRGDRNASRNAKRRACPSRDSHSANKNKRI
jgi:hypothetical protein